MSASLALALPVPWHAAVGARAGGLPARQGLMRALLILAVHGMLVVALIQKHPVPALVHQARPLTVSLLALARPAPVEPQAAASVRRPPLPAMPVLPPPEIVVAGAAPAPLPAPAVAAAATPPTLPAPALPAAPAMAAAPPALAAVQAMLPPARPEPRPAGPGAIRYRVPPAIEVPMASRRLGEHGTVMLRVVVDVNGLPRQISLHQSSGFARLDEQALQAMRSARFQPLVDSGGAYEWLVIAPLQYDID